MVVKTNWTWIWIKYHGNLWEHLFVDKHFSQTPAKESKNQLCFKRKKKLKDKNNSTYILSYYGSLKTNNHLLLRPWSSSPGAAKAHLPDKDGVSRLEWPTSSHIVMLLKVAQEIPLFPKITRQVAFWILFRDKMGAKCSELWLLVTSKLKKKARVPQTRECQMQIYRKYKRQICFHRTKQHRIH